MTCWQTEVCVRVHLGVLILWWTLIKTIYSLNHLNYTQMPPSESGPSANVVSLNPGCLCECVWVFNSIHNNIYGVP